MSYLYAIQMVIPDYPNPIKIGFSTTLRQRMLAYSCGPFPIERLGAWPGTKQDEKAIHAQFAGSRLAGEWFYPTEDLLNLIESKGAKRGRQIRRARPNAERYREKVRRVNIMARRRAIIDRVVENAQKVLAINGKPYLSDYQVGLLLDTGSKVVREFTRDREIPCVDGEIVGYLPEHIATFLETRPQYVDYLADSYFDAEVAARAA